MRVFHVKFIRIDGLVTGIYFIGKLAWPKGFKELFHLLSSSPSIKRNVERVDIFGDGPHKSAIEKEAIERRLPIRFHDGVDHASLTDYKIFVNPSSSEVLCTATLEVSVLNSIALLLNKSLGFGNGQVGDLSEASFK